MCDNWSENSFWRNRPCTWAFPWVTGVMNFSASGEGERWGRARNTNVWRIQVPTSGSGEVCGKLESACLPEGLTIKFSHARSPQMAGVYSHPDLPHFLSLSQALFFYFVHITLFLKEFILFYLRYLFIWLHWVLVVALASLAAACRLSCPLASGS